MRSKTLIEQIEYIEEKLDVGSFYLRDDKLWPILRIFILLSRPKTNKSSGISLNTRIRFLMQGITEFFKWKFNLWPHAQNAFLSSSHYKVKEHNKYYDRIINPFLEELNHNNTDFIVFEFTGNFSYPLNLNYADKIIKIQPLLYLLSFVWRLKYFFCSTKYVDNFRGDFKKFNKLCNEEGISFKIDKAFFLRMFLLEKHALFFEKILKKFKVERVGMVCYYDFKSLALTWAANRLGLDNIDFQHGVQGALHPAYGKWPKHIVENSVFIPTHFWVWDQFSFNTINEWKHSDRVILGCNKWMLDRVSKLKPEIILFTAQPLENPIPFSLIEAIKNYTGELKWFLRLHPHQINEMHKFEKILKREGIWDKTNVNEASFTPLSELLSIAKVHITKSSSVAIEGSYYNIPTIFLSEIAISYYKYQLPESLQYHLNKGQHLNEIIDSVESEEIKPDENSKLLNRFYTINNFFN